LCLASPLEAKLKVGYTVLNWIQQTMTSLGYPGVAFLMFLENIFPPIPSELIMPLAGFTAGTGELSFVGVVLAGALGSLLGQLPLYYLGRWVGEDKLVAWADRYGKWLAISGAEVKKADDWFDRHGHKAVFLARLIPGLRSLISIPAGISEMRLTTFLLYSAFGTSLWVLLLATLGSILGENYELVDTYLGPVALVVLGAVAVLAVVWVVRRRAKRQSA
jgi:membrane protein DedA with SNARE-associated domain